MPPIETADLYDDAVLWSASGYTSDGEVTVSAPVAIKCRWEWVASQTTQVDGTIIGTEATIATNRVLSNGDILWLGEFADRPTSSTSAGQNPLVQVVAVKRANDVKSRATRCEVKAQRYKATLPALD